MNTNPVRRKSVIRKSVIRKSVIRNSVIRNLMIRNLLMRVTMIAVFLLFGLLYGELGRASFSQAKTYTIGPKTKPCDRTQHYGNYNKNTKSFYVIRSYLQKINRQKGGTLVIKKGTYKISNTLYVGSNTHIKLKKGAVLKKIKKGGPLNDASSSMFQFVTEKKAKKTGAYGKHNGEKNISITGSGTIDLNYVKMSKDVIGIIMGHNKNITLKGITMKNMCFGHMIEMDACENVKILNCKFTGFKASGNWNKEAINLDTPDKDRSGFNSNWSKKDKTPNESVLIQNCVFDTLEVGVGTHRYTGGAYQTDVTITGCTFNKNQTALRILNYKDVTITGNTFTNCTPNSRYDYSMFFAGIHGIDFSYNSFTNCGKGGDLLEFWCDKGYSANQTLYDPVFSELTEDEAEKFLTNTAKGCTGCLIYKCPYDVDFTQEEE